MIKIQKKTKLQKLKELKLSIRQGSIERSQLDSQYIQIRQSICNTRLYLTTNRHLRIRLDLWSRKLDQIVNDIPWKKNRNTYIKLMYLMTQSEVIVEPFLTLPPEGELPYLRNYEINTIIDLVQSKINQRIYKNGLCQYCLSEGKQTNFTYRFLQTSDSNVSQSLLGDEKERKSVGKYQSYRSAINKQNETNQNYQTRKSNPPAHSFRKYKNNQVHEQKPRNGGIGKPRMGMLQQIEMDSFNIILKQDTDEEQLDGIEEIVMIPVVPHNEYFSWKVGNQ